MKAYLEKLNPQGEIEQIPVTGVIPRHTFNSLKAIREILILAANNLWGIEGLDYAICNDPSCLVPVYARNRHNMHEIRIR